MDRSAHRCRPTCSSGRAGRDSACPRCALPVGPFADLQRRLRRVPGPFAGLRRGPGPGDRTRGRSATSACGSSTSGTPGWPPGSATCWSRRGGPRSPGSPPMPGSCRFPLHWWRRLWRGYNQADALAVAWPGGSTCPFASPLRRVKATDPLAHKGATERLEAMRRGVPVPPRSGSEGSHDPPRRRHPDHRRHLGAAARRSSRPGQRVVVVVLARTLVSQPERRPVGNRGRSV